MAIWRAIAAWVIILIGARAPAKQLVKVPVQFPSISPAVSAFARIYDLMRPSPTQDDIVNEQIQRKSLEHTVDRAGLKEPPRLERIFDYSVALKVRNELRAKGGRP